MSSPRTAPTCTSVPAVRGTPSMPAEATFAAATTSLVERLGSLVDEAAGMALDDERWSDLRRRAGQVTSQLVVAGRVPAALVVAAADPPVVVARLLAVAARSLVDAATVGPSFRCA